MSLLKYNGFNKHKINMYKNCARSFDIFDPHMEPAHDQSCFESTQSLWYQPITMRRFFMTFLEDVPWAAVFSVETHESE